MRPSHLGRSRRAPCHHAARRLSHRPPGQRRCGRRQCGRPLGWRCGPAGEGGVGTGTSSCGDAGGEQCGQARARGGRGSARVVGVAGSRVPWGPMGCTPRAPSRHSPRAAARRGPRRRSSTWRLKGGAARRTCQASEQRVSAWVVAGCRCGLPRPRHAGGVPRPRHARPCRGRAAALLPARRRARVWPGAPVSLRAAGRSTRGPLPPVGVAGSRVPWGPMGCTPSAVAPLAEGRSSLRAAKT